MNTVSKIFTNLPAEICYIIYEYNKLPELPYLDEIVNPFNKYCLKSVLNRVRDWASYWHEGSRTTFWENNIVKHQNVGIFKVFELKDKYTYPFMERTLQNSEFGCYHSDLRHKLKSLCRRNRIEYKDRTPTKILIKKLLEL